MTYQALAITYRPQSFADFTGQASTVTALSNALNKQQLHHAYLFSGTRGVGKTTLARLLSKCLNCEQSISAEPCQRCASCVDITGGRHMDLIEIDAASRTKVEDTRELLDNVPYAATSGRFKIYLIDEVHMLSKHSFNALLKTLEEPPAHVKFILATTEPEKIPSTIRSRCLHFALTQISPEQLQERLGYVLQKEQINFDKDALAPIIKAANGSLRDALSLLDKTIAYADGDLTLQQVNVALGLDHSDTSCQLIECLAQSDVKMMLQITAQLAEYGHHFSEQLQALCQFFHQIASQQLLGDEPINPDSAEAILKLSKLFEPAQVQVYYQICLNGQKDMPYAPTPQIGFEMTLFRMLAFVPQAVSAQPQPASPAASTKPKTVHAAQGVTKPSTKPLPVAKRNSPQAPASKDTPASPIQSRWLQMVDQLDLEGMSQQAVQHCTCSRWAAQGIVLHAEPKHMPMLSENQQAKIKQAIQKHLNSDIAVTFSFGQASENTTPAQVKQRAHELKIQASVDKMQQDTSVNALKEHLDATLIPESVVLSDD